MRLNMWTYKGIDEFLVKEMMRLIKNKIVLWIKIKDKEILNRIKNNKFEAWLIWDWGLEWFFS